MGLRENEVVVVEEFIWNVKRTARFQLRWDLVAKQVAKGTGEGGGGREKRGKEREGGRFRIQYSSGWLVHKVFAKVPFNRRWCGPEPQDSIADASIRNSVCTVAHADHRRRVTRVIRMEVHLQALTGACRRTEGGRDGEET